MYICVLFFLRFNLLESIHMFSIHLVYPNKYLYKIEESDKWVGQLEINLSFRSFNDDPIGRREKYSVMEIRMTRTKHVDRDIDLAAI